MPDSHNLSRRDFVGLGAAGLAVAAASPRDLFARFAERPNRPNVLWVVSEDNNPFIGAYGDGIARTPNIDALAKRGILYKNVFAAAPVCASSRFSILTGVHAESCAPANHTRARAVLPPALRTWPQYMREAGYYVTNNQKADWNCSADSGLLFDSTGPLAHWRNRPPGQPFMAVLNSRATHESSLFLPGGNEPVQPEFVRIPAYLPNTPEVRADRAKYYNRMEQMDKEVGGWLDELETARLLDDTIVFYFSDHGGALPRSKRYCTNAGLRCAMVVAFGNRWLHLAPAPEGAEVSSPVSLVDLAPSLLSLAGMEKPPHMQGHAFLGQHTKPPRTYAFGMRNRMDERYDFVRAATDGRYHYIRSYTPHRPMGQHAAFEWLANGYQSWEREWRAGRLTPVQSRFFAGVRPYEELYDLRKDKDQVNNLVGDVSHAARLRAMRGALDEHMFDVNDNGFIPEGMSLEGYLPSRARGAYPLARLMQLGELAAHRNALNVSRLTRELDDPHPVVRHWALQGLLMLGGSSAAARTPLEYAMRHDALPQNRIVAAEAVATLSPSPEAIDVLQSLLARSNQWPVRLQALNSLTFVGDQAKRALPEIRAAATDRQQYLRNAGRYLEAVLDGRYDPSYRVFEEATVELG